MGSGRPVRRPLWCGCPGAPAGTRWACRAGRGREGGRGSSRLCLTLAAWGPTGAAGEVGRGTGERTG